MWFNTIFFNMNSKSIYIPMQSMQCLPNLTSICAKLGIDLSPRDGGHKKPAEEFPHSPPLMRCSFCEKSGIRGHTSHNLRDDLHRLTCPELRKRVCTHCFAFGDHAHTNKHCPKRKRDSKMLMISQCVQSNQWRVCGHTHKWDVETHTCLVPFSYLAHLICVICKTLCNVMSVLVLKNFFLFLV